MTHSAEQAAMFTNFRRMEMGRVNRPMRSMYLGRRLHDTSVLNPVIRCKYLTCVLAILDGVHLLNAKDRQLDVTNLADLEYIWGDRGWETSIQENMMIVWAMELVRDGAYEERV